MRIEEQRIGTQEAAEHAADLIEDATCLLAQARELLKSNPDLAIRMIADSQALLGQAWALQERIRRLMTEARLGRD